MFPLTIWTCLSRQSMNQTIFHGRQIPVSIKNTMQSMEPTVIKNSTSLKLTLMMKTMMSKKPQRNKLQLLLLKRPRRKIPVAQRHLVKDLTSRRLWHKHNHGNRNIQRPMISQIVSYQSNSIGEMLMGMISQVRLETRELVDLAIQWPLHK